MGGPERVARLLHERGKLDARQRSTPLFDPGTFVEIGALVGGDEVPADALVAGFGKIDGRTALAGAEDFSVLGGSIGPARWRSATGSASSRARSACRSCSCSTAPAIASPSTLGGGGRAPNDLLALADLSGQVPMVCLVLGASAGHGALTSPLSRLHDHERGRVDVHGRAAAREGRDRRGRDQGGARRAEVCAEIAGTAHNVAPDDADRDRARAALSALLPVEPRRAPRRAATGPTPGRAGSTDLSS